MNIKGINQRWGLFSLLGGILYSGSVLALTPWQSVTQPVAGTPQAIGGFSNGCLIGAQPLPLQAGAYQVLRPQQKRYFGHPDLLSFIQRMTDTAHRERLGSVLIGDMSMPAGGRFSRGHASHQTGLDVDIWLQLPQHHWSDAQLYQPQPLDLVSADGKQVMARHWRPEIARLIQLAAEDPEVTRIFVNPAIKLRLCEEAQGDRAWLRKVRPWFGHRAHMHVRLTCPANSRECEPQAPPPEGEGCGAELTSWFAPPPPSSEKQVVKPPPPPLPASCQRLLDNQFKALP